ncbi:hypothetical protein BHM03_00023398 [Ensete ventricosum]|nr:hypothetical protein BHM03_00023398 [Ensete ventricosum]
MAAAASSLASQFSGLRREVLSCESAPPTALFLRRPHRCVVAMAGTGKVTSLLSSIYSQFLPEFFCWRQLEMRKFRTSYFLFTSPSFFFFMYSESMATVYSEIITLWTNNGTKDSITKLVADLNDAKLENNVDIVVAPQVKQSLTDHIEISAQNCWNTDGYHPYRAVHTGLPADRNVDRLLLGRTIDWGCFHHVTTRNRPVMVDFDRRWLLSGDNGRFRPSVADFGQYQPREKEEEGEEKGEPGVDIALPVPSPARSIARERFLHSRDLLPAGDFFNCTICRPRAISSPGGGEGTK